MLKSITSFTLGIIVTVVYSYIFSFIVFVIVFAAWSKIKMSSISYVDIIAGVPYQYIVFMAAIPMALLIITIAVNIAVNQIGKK